MPEQRERLPHLILRQAPRTERYTSPQTGGGGFSRKQQDRNAHGRRLQAQLRAAQASAGPDGVRLEFRSEPGFELALDSLEARRSGIQLLSTVERKSPSGATVTVATVFVPLGKTGHFTQILEKYLTQNSPSGNPRNSKLVDNIAAIRRAVLDSFWTDSEEARPRPRERAWWEMWLRLPDERYFAQFRHAAEAARIEVSSTFIKFLDRRVVLIRATREQFESHPLLLDFLAELRRAKETAGEFLKLPPREQAEWVQDLRRRLQGPGPDSPVVCVLDTGVNRGHELLEGALPAASLFAYRSSWRVTDHDGHGTEMAGVALYGDLTPLVASGERVVLEHGLESVKILPPQGQNPPPLYGAITMDAAAQVESVAPRRRRTFSLAVTTNEGRDRGAPSSWSATIDQVAAGVGEADGGKRRLFCVSAGNTDRSSWPAYPESNQIESVRDPGQSWNALTVGAFADRIQITDAAFDDWSPLARPGDLGVSSTTSLVWQPRWPVKPDVVLDGGNHAISPDRKEVDPVDELSLLTTFWKPLQKQFVATGETSAATAQAARIAARIQARYPQLWPETIRALIVDSARWTTAMLERFPPQQSRRSGENLIRVFGYGVPNQERALWSASNSLSLIVQGDLQPFDRDGSDYKTRDLNLHSLPWPRETLEEIGAASVEMRVTLSYFVEPDPARRGAWKTKYRYASHGLRFDVKSATESERSFRARINRQARDDESGHLSWSSDSDQWVLGPTLRKAGSLHSDIWKGPAADLASKDAVAVFPVTGWWKERHHLERWNSRARYALVVSIHAPEVEADLYTPIAAILRVPVVVTT